MLTVVHEWLQTTNAKVLLGTALHALYNFLVAGTDIVVFVLVEPDIVERIFAELVFLYEVCFAEFDGPSAFDRLAMARKNNLDFVSSGEAHSSRSSILPE